MFNLLQTVLLRGNYAPKIEIVNQLSCVMGIRRCAEQMELNLPTPVDHSVTITSVKNGKVTVILTPIALDL